MEELKITRFYLFTLAQDKVLNDGLFAISEMYKMSATTIKDMENNLIEYQKETVDFFINMLENNLKGISEQDNHYNKKYVKTIKDGFKEKIRKRVNTSYINCFYYLLEIISDYQNKFMEKFFPKEGGLYRKWHYDDSYKTKVFLSYAYLDKGISLALFYHFFKEGIFLYVDWMHNNAIMNCSTLKRDLICNLFTSRQLLLLRTINSELNIQRGNKTIRQWCAWELGCFYFVNKNEKYYLDFYGNDFVKTTKTPNPFLDTVKKMQGIINGRIV